MENHFRRLDRIEAAISTRFAWEGVCPVCARQGLTETPYEHCEASQCGALNGGTGISITHEQAAKMREAFERGCIAKGTTYEREMAAFWQEDKTKREAWGAKKRAMRKAVRG